MRFIIYLLVNFPFLVFSNTIIGSIKNNQQQGVPYVNISIIGTSSGTVSSQSGEYNLNLDTQKCTEISFSSIGYITKTIKASELIKEPDVILTKNTYDLDEMVIMPDSSLRSLLRDAYRLIPKNYPNTPTSYEGFYRTALKDGNNNYLRFTEAITRSYKSSYKNKGQGVSELINSRKYIDNKGSIDFPIYFYGGLNSFHVYDYVKERYSFLKGDKHFDYKLCGITKYNEQDVYVIELKKAGGERYTAKMYIDRTSLAYLRIESLLKDDEINRKDLEMKGLDMKTVTKNINYEKNETGTYYLKSIFTNSSFLLKKDSSAYTIPVEYVTTYFNNKDAAKIAPKDQLSSSFIPALEAIDYQESNWKGYTTIALNLEQVNIDTVASSIKLHTKPPKDWKQMTIKQMIKLEYGVGIISQTVNINEGHYQLKTNDLSFDKHRNSSAYIYGYNAYFSYKIDNLNALYWSSTDILNKDNYFKQNEIGYKRTLPIKTIGKDILFEVDGAWQWGEVGYSLGTANSTQPFNFGGKTFKQEKIQAYTGVNTYGFKANGTLSIQLSNRLYLDLTGGYLCPLNSSDVIILNERSGFYLTRKTASESLSNDKIDYSINGISTTSSNINLNNWSLSVGIKIKL